MRSPITRRKHVDLRKPTAHREETRAALAVKACVPSRQGIEPSIAEWNNVRFWHEAVLSCVYEGLK
jgi:hypothetical protein